MRAPYLYYRLPPEMMDINEIREYLPHRYPFLLVDRVVDLDVEAQRIRAYKNVSINEPFFNGHFPAHPIMPGVLIIEAMAQAAGILGFKMLDVKPADGTLYYFVGSDKLRFRQPVLPGDQLILEAKFISCKRQIWKFECQASVDGIAGMLGRDHLRGTQTMSLIDPRAIIDPSAKIADGVEVGPWSIVGAGVEIGEGTVIGPHVILKGPTRIGKHNRIYQFSSVGEDTPDLKYKGEPTRLVIGDHNVIREGVTIHRGTVQDRSETTLGDHNLVMAYAHIGHDSVIGNHCILVNNTALAGHVHVGDWAILSGFTLVHQFCHIGAHSFSGMGTAIGKDVPAFVTVFGNPAEARSMNFEGMRRRGFSDEAIHALRRAYKVVYRQNLTVDQAIAELAEPAQQFPEVDLFVKSIQNSARGITR